MYPTRLEYLGVCVGVALVTSAANRVLSRKHAQRHSLALNHQLAHHDLETPSYPAERKFEALYDPDFQT